MPASAEDIAKGLELLKLTRAFVEKHHIYAPESIYQMDRIYEDAPCFIESVVEVVGYKPMED